MNAARTRAAFDEPARRLPERPMIRLRSAIMIVEGYMLVSLVLSAIDNREPFD
jgi:hypothetical protein